MNKFIMLLLLMLSVVSTAVEAKGLPKVVYDVHEATTLISETEFSDLHVIVVPDASFVKVHFDHFQIPKGVIVRVRNEAGTEVYNYAKHSKDQHTMAPGDDGVHSFSAMSITGDTAVVEVFGYNPSVKSVLNRLDIDYYSAGLPQDQIDELYQSFRQEQAEESGSPESTCGLDDKVPTPCIIDTYPAEYERMRPVARITNGTGSLCTAWRVGPDNRLFTNNHCNQTQAHIQAAEIWFNYEYTDCQMSGKTSGAQIVKVSGDQLLATAYVQDMTLFTVNSFELLEPFGYFGLEVRPPVLGELIYRGGHGSGRPKLATIESDVNENGLCQIDQVSKSTRGPDSDTGYYCDSIGGSSGSPVLLRENHRAIALHHYSGCTNSGVRMDGIWPLVSDYFGGVIPNGDDDPGANRIPPVADIQLDCTFGVCNFDGSGSFDPDGTVVSYSWDFGDGTSSTEMSPTKTYDTTGIYIAKLLIKDNETNPGYVAKQFSVTLEGENIPPVIAYSITDDNNYTAYFTSESFDWDGDIVQYEWRVRDTGVYSDWIVGDKTFSWTYQIGGKQIIQLRVTDDFGANPYKSLWFVVNGPIMNQDPVAGMIVTAVNGYDTWNFVDNSTDDGYIARYYWYWADGTPTSHEENPGDHTFVLPDGVTEKDFRPYLYVEDNHGVTNVAFSPILHVTTPPPNEAPVADFTYDTKLTKVAFTDASTDDRNNIVSWSWDFGDGGTSTEQSPAYVYPSVLGDYNVTLEVTDGEGLTDATTLSVHVDPVPPSVISLTFSSQKASKGTMDLRFDWSGAPTDNVTIYRDNSLVDTYTNDGNETFSVKRNEKGHVYKVCEVNTTSRPNACSNPVSISF